MISNGCICTNMLLPKCSQVPVLTSRDMTGLYHHRSLRLHVEHDRPVQRVYARQACSCGRAAAGVQLRACSCVQLVHLPVQLLLPPQLMQRAVQLLHSAGGYASGKVQGGLLDSTYSLGYT